MKNVPFIVCGKNITDFLANQYFTPYMYKFLIVFTNSVNAHYF